MLVDLSREEVERAFRSMQTVSPAPGFAEPETVAAHESGLSKLRSALEPDVADGFCYVACCRACELTTAILVDSPRAVEDSIGDLAEWLGRGDYLIRVPTAIARQRGLCKCEPAEGGEGGEAS